jgi:hypothetical protein
MALVLLLMSVVPGIGLLSAVRKGHVPSGERRRASEVLFVAESGLHAVISGLKSGASDVVGATFPPGADLFTDAGLWGFTMARYPGGVRFQNMPAGRFLPGDPTAAVVVSIPHIGRGRAQATVWLKSGGGNADDPTVFHVAATGWLPEGTTHTIAADLALVPRGGRPAEAIQAGGLEGPVLHALPLGTNHLGGHVAEGGATVLLLRRATNDRSGWEHIGTVKAAENPAGGGYAFRFELPVLPLRGEVYSAVSQSRNGGPWSRLAFPVVVD